MSTRSLLQPEPKAVWAFALAGVGLWASTPYFTKIAFAEDTERDIEIFLYLPSARDTAYAVGWGKHIEHRD